MNLVRIATFKITENVSPISMFLLERGIKHEIVEDRQGQHLLVDADKAERVAQLLRDPSLGRSSYTERDTARMNGGRGTLRIWPVSCALVILGVLGFLIYRFETTFTLIAYLTFSEVSFSSYDFHFLPASETYGERWQLWRLITPAFLHFSLFHILFNALGIWELGRRLEVYLGSGLYLLAFVILAVAANLTQYWASGPSLFGGLSGALFGFVGLIAVLYLKGRHPLMRLPTGIYFLVGITLVAGLIGAFSALFAINVANGAHLGGLGAGLILGAVLPLNRLNSRL